MLSSWAAKMTMARHPCDSESTSRCFRNDHQLGPAAMTSHGAELSWRGRGQGRSSKAAAHESQERRRRETAAGHP